MAEQTVSLKLLIAATNSASKEVVKLRDQINGLSEGVEKLGRDSARGGKQGAEGMRTFAESAKAAKKATEGFASAGATLLGIAASISATTFFPVKSAADFEQALSGVIAVTSNAENSLESLKETASDLGRTTKFTATEAAVGMQFLGQAGFDAGEVITGIGPSLQLAVAAAVDLGSAANIATNVLSGMRLPVEDLQQVVDVLAKTAAESNAELLDMADALSYAGPIAAAAGVGINDLASVVGVLGNAGIQGSRAGTALRGTLFALTDPAGEAKDTLDKLGVSISLSADGSIDLIDAFHQLADANLTVADAQKIFGRFASAGVLAITSQIDALDEMVISNNAAAGSAQKMADIMKDNLKGSFTELLSAVDGLKRAFGDPLLKPIRVLVQFATKLAGVFTGIADRVPILISVLGILAVAVAGVAAALGTLAVAIAATTATMNQLAIANLRLLPILASTKAALISMALSAKGVGVWFLDGAKAMGVMRAASVALIAGMKKLWLVVKAHPILLIAAAITGLVLVMNEWEESLRRAASEAGTASIQFEALRSSYTKNVAALKEMKEGSEKATATGKNMREQLLKLAEENKEVASEALVAANSIDAMSGKIRDGGEALDKFIGKSKELAQVNMRKQIDLLSDALDRSNYKLWDGVALWQHFKEGLDAAASSLLPWGKTYQDVMDESIQRTKDQTVAVERANRAYVELLQTQGQFDPTASSELQEQYFEKVLGFTKERAKALVSINQEMQREAAMTRDITGEIEKLSTEELNQQIAQTTKEINGLKEAYEGISEVTEETARQIREDAASGKISAEEEQEAIRKLWDFRVQASQALTQKEEEQNQLLLTRRREYREALKDSYDKELKDLEKQKELGQLTEVAYSKRVVELDLNRAAKQEENALALQASLLKLNKETQEKLAASGTIGKDLEKANQATIDAKQKAADLEVKITINKNKVLAELEEEAKDIRLDLMEDGPEKFEKQMKAEVDALIAANKEKEIYEEELGGIIGAIRAKYRKQEDDFREEERLKAEEEAKKKAEAEQKRQDDIDKIVKPAQTTVEDEAVEDDPEAKNQLELDRLANLHDAKISQLIELGAKEVEITAATNAKVIELDRLKAEQQKAIEEERKKFLIKGLDDTLMASVEFFGKQSKLSKAAFALQKLVAIRETIMSTYQGATDAYKALSGIYLIGPALGAAAAAAAVAAGLARVSQIRSQTLAEGGEVKGKSSHSKSDNIPIMATAKEFMQPVSAVRYYGRDIMEAMRRKIIPREVFRELPVPVYMKTPSPKYRYQTGGQVTPGSNGGGMGMPMAEQKQEIKIMNFTDQRELLSALGTPDGEDVVLNVISKNKDKVSRVLR